MPTIGMREFKDRATEVVRSVREEGETYIITVNGEPSAVLKPVEPEKTAEQRKVDIEAWIQRAEEIGRRLEAGRTDLRDCVELVSEQRR